MNVPTEAKMSLSYIRRKTDEQTLSTSASLECVVDFQEEPQMT